MQCKSLWIKASAKCINVNVNVPVSVSGTLAEHLLWPWATERSARPQSGILSGFAHMLCSTHPSKSRLSLGRQHIACYVVWAALLSAVALRTLYFTHFKLFYFPNVIGLVQRIVRFVCVPNRKPRTERFNTNTCIVTPLIYIYIYNMQTRNSLTRNLRPLDPVIFFRFCLVTIYCNFCLSFQNKK